MTMRHTPFALVGITALLLCGIAHARAETVQYGPPAAGGGSAPCNSFGTGPSNCIAGTGDASNSTTTAGAPNAVAVTATQRAAYTVNGFDFGMNCNATSDNTTALQNAINAAQQLGTPGSNNGGGVLQLPGGYCKIFNTVTITNPITIQGAGNGIGPPGTGPTPVGSGGTVVRTINTTDDVFSVTSDAPVVFQNFAIDFQGTTKTGGAGIHLDSASSGTAMIGSKIIGMQLRNLYDGIFLNNSFGNKIIGNFIFTCNHDGIHMAASATFNDGSLAGEQILGNVIEPFTASAGSNADIEINGGGGFEIVGNELEGGAYGILVNLNYTTGTLLIGDNSIATQVNASIALTQATSGAEYANVVIHHNKFAQLGAHTLTQGTIYVGPGTPTVAFRWIRNIIIQGNTWNHTANDVGTDNALINIHDGTGITIDGNVFGQAANTATYSALLATDAADNVKFCTGNNLSHGNGGISIGGFFALKTNWAAVSTCIPPKPNLLLNPGFRFDQSNEGAAVSFTSGAVYCEDEWTITLSATNGQTATCQRSTDAPTGQQNSLLATVTASGATAAGDFAKIIQPLPGFALTPLAYGSASALPSQLTFQLKSSITGTFGVSLVNQANTRGFVQNCVITAAATWTTCVVPVLPDTSGTWISSGTARAGSLNIFLASGSLHNTATAGVWFSAGPPATTSAQTNLTETNAATFQISGVKWETGMFPTAPELLPYNADLSSVKQFYQKTFPLGTAPAQNAGIAGALSTVGSVVTAGTISVDWRFAPEMACAPSGAATTTYAPSSATSNWTDSAALAATVLKDPDANASTTGITIAEQTSAIVVGRRYYIHATANCRL